MCVRIASRRRSSSARSGIEGCVHSLNERGAEDPLLTAPRREARDQVLSGLVVDSRWPSHLVIRGRDTYVSCTSLFSRDRTDVSSCKAGTARSDEVSLSRGRRRPVAKGSPADCASDRSPTACRRRHDRAASRRGVQIVHMSSSAIPSSSDVLGRRDVGRSPDAKDRRRRGHRFGAVVPARSFGSAERTGRKHSSSTPRPPTIHPHLLLERDARPIAAPAIRTPARERPPDHHPNRPVRPFGLLARRSPRVACGSRAEPSPLDLI
jgi:hypothetical protein